MNRVDKYAGHAFKVTIALYVLVLVFQAGFRPDIYRAVNVLLQVCSAILMFYIFGKWALTKLGFFESGSLKISRKALLKTLGAAFVLILLVAGSEVLYHKTSITQEAFGDLQASNDGLGALGAPIRIGWFIAGSMHLKGDDGAASLSIPVIGSKGAGKLKVNALKKAGTWQIVDLYLAFDRNGAVVQIPH